MWGFDLGRTPGIMSSMFHRESHGGAVAMATLIADLTARVRAGLVDSARYPTGERSQ